MDTLAQHFHIPAICLLRVFIVFALYVQQIFPGHGLCVLKGSALQRAGIQDGLEASGELGGPLKPVGKRPSDKIQSQSVSCTHWTMSAFFGKSPAFSQLPSFCSLLLLPGK